MRTRFAPSPTGFLHIGGLRTALYAYLIAKQNKGPFIVRIEDTDQSRSVEGATENQLHSLHWAGIEPDEGVMMKENILVQEGTYGPYIQSERLELYQKYAKKLLDDGNAYPCFCTPGRLDQMRKDQQAKKEAPMYDRLCMHLSKEEVAERVESGEPHVLRLKVPRDEAVTYEDDIRGKMVFKGHTIDDQVLLKSDGFPTYHLAHVVDDHLMDIAIIVRGEEWLSSTPKHLLLFQFLGWKPPRYAHVPLMLNKDKSKLSKRQNDVAVRDYIEEGYLPETIVNFIALLGWNPGTTQEIFTMEELIDQFSLERIQKSGAIFDRDRLEWMQGQWIRNLSAEEFADRIRPIVAEKYSAAHTDADFQAKAALIQDRLTFFKEAPEMLSFFYEEPKVDKEIIANKKQKVEVVDLPKIIDLLIATLDPVDDWNEENLKEILFSVAEEKDYKKGQILWPLRAILTGLPYSPGAFEVATALGKEESLSRLHKAKKELS